MKDFKVWDIFILSWKDFKKSWKFLLLALLFFMFLGFLDNFFGGYKKNLITGEWEGSIFVAGLFYLIKIYLSGWFILEILKITDGKKPSFKRLFNWPNSWLRAVKFVVGYILYTIIIVAPILIASFFLLKYQILNSVKVIFWFGIAIVLSVVLAYYLTFAYYLLAENRSKKICDNIKKSFQMVSKNHLKIFVWYGYVILIIVGVSIFFSLVLNLLVALKMTLLSFLIGVSLFIVILVLLWWLTISFAHLYRKIDPEVKEN